MFARMSPGARFMFTPEQLDEIKRAFSARSRGAHVLDIRLSLAIFGKSYYVVLLGGRERRGPPRAAMPVTILSYSFLAALLLLAACAAAAAA